MRDVMRKVCASMMVHLSSKPALQKAIEPVLKRLLIECEVLEIPNGATHDPAALVAPRPNMRCQEPKEGLSLLLPKKQRLEIEKMDLPSMKYEEPRKGIWKNEQ